MNKWLVGGGIVVVLLVVGGVLLSMRSAPQSQPQQEQTQTQTPANAQAVNIEGSAFSPATITVKKGATVTWTNKDSTRHNVVSDSDAPAGGPPLEAELLNQGDSFSFTFNTVGTFPYHCSPHPFMTGVVEVTE